MIATNPLQFLQEQLRGITTDSALISTSVPTIELVETTRFVDSSSLVTVNKDQPSWFLHNSVALKEKQGEQEVESLLEQIAPELFTQPEEEYSDTFQDELSSNYRNRRLGIPKNLKSIRDDVSFKEEGEDHGPVNTWNTPWIIVLVLLVVLIFACIGCIFCIKKRTSKKVAEREAKSLNQAGKDHGKSSSDEKKMKSLSSSTSTESRFKKISNSSSDMPHNKGSKTSSDSCITEYYYYDLGTHKECESPNRNMV